MGKPDDAVQALRWKAKPNWTDHVYPADPPIISLVMNLSTDEKAALLNEPNTWPSSVPHMPFEALTNSLRSSPGFVLIRCDSSLSDEALRCVYAYYSRCFGALNNRYGFFFDVVDQGLDYRKEAIPVSKTKATTGYHTDSTAKEYLPEIIGLLCLQPAASGGDSLLTNAANLYIHLSETRPEALSAMEQPIIRDVITPGTVNHVNAIVENAFPIFAFPDEEFTFRYMRYWIETAFSKTGRELPKALAEGLDATDAFFSAQPNAIQFRMERGDILFVNNRFLCHNRTGFEDHPQKEKARTLVRTWINFNRI